MRASERVRVAPAASVTAAQAAAAAASGPGTAAKGDRPARAAWQQWQQSVSGFQQQSVVKSRGASSGSSVCGSHSTRRGCGDDDHLLLALVHLVVQPVAVAHVEQQDAEDRLDVHDRLKLDHLQRRSARSGTRAAARDVAGSWCGGRACGQRAAPACVPVSGPLKPFKFKTVNKR